MKELKDRPVIVAPAPTGPVASAGGPTPPDAPSPPSAGSAEEKAANREKARKALADLASEDGQKVFSATMTLAKYGDLEAVEPLLKVLKEHKDFYARMGAATAFKSLKACDAVIGLIEALLDKESVVFSAASTALIEITRIEEKDLTELNLRVASDTSKQRRTEARQKWVTWWRTHEEQVRKVLNQPKGGPPAPADGAQEPGK